MSCIDAYRVQPGTHVDLRSFPTDDDGGMSKKVGVAKAHRQIARLSQLQELMYAEGKHSLLVVLQAMDAGGKDSTIRNVFGPINPQGCNVVGFKVPNDLERRHDFLWRVHQQTPPAGYMTLFNRSHYEDVLVVRVQQLVPAEVWQQRYEHINNFERMLHDSGTTIVKFFLHISRDYQKDRLQRRLARPDKLWKFNPGDLVERARWDDYMKAYEDALSLCSTEHSPWYVIPAETRWFRNLLIARILVRTLKRLNMEYPPPSFDPAGIEVT